MRTLEAVTGLAPSLQEANGPFVPRWEVAKYLHAFHIFITCQCWRLKAGAIEGTGLACTKVLRTWAIYWVEHAAVGSLPYESGGFCKHVFVDHG